MLPTSFIPVSHLTETASVRVSAEQRQLIHMAASILLDYPTPERYENFPLIRSELTAAKLPTPVAQALSRFLEAPEFDDLQSLEKHYVSIFDLKRRATMYLSYYLTGDTRKRGTALVRFTEAYRAGGCEVDRDELPDYLPMVLEFSAVGDTQIAGDLLSSHREGIELLRTTLESSGSPYAGLVAAICMTLPAIDRATKERYLKLITDGPPAEMVGATAMGPLEPFTFGETNGSH
ncbi:nitrate reductase molybdenum cofactor assembly chaperone [Flaviflexus equikiangi]|uniref:nitrate reductase molybdenum cofactor assembly chaperone n=1 Tax=Flaviflexus equikiangi TaxID=2758573 RepID=UPI0015F3D13E|nr:nitrate reductase molybdenum cofactor assembly chaperone [Flaviflexus equikiangi]